MANGRNLTRRTLLRATGIALGALALGGCNTTAEAATSHRLAFVCTIVDDEYWQRCIAGIQDADAGLACQTQVYGPSSTEDFVARTPAYLQEAIESQPDAILTYGGISSLGPLIDQASDQGIPVITVDADAPDTARVAFVGPDPYLSGYTCAQALLDRTRGSGKLAALLSSLSATKEVEKLRALRDAMSEYDLDLVAGLECGHTAQSAYEVTRMLFQMHPEVTALFTTSSFIGTGAAQALEELGRDDVELMAYDDVSQNVAYLRSGVIDVLVVQDPYQMGYEAVQVACQYLEEGGLPQEFYDLDVVLVTQENVDTYKQQ